MKNFSAILYKYGIILFIIIASILLITGCPLFPKPESSSWTIMVYMDADNNLESYGIEDLNEMEGVNLENSDIHVIVLIDRITFYDSSNGDWTDTRLYEVAYDPSGSTNSIIVSTELASTELGLTTGGSEELDMGDPAVCSSFIDFCKSEYPADKYFLVLWNHGDGWTKKNIASMEDIEVPDKPDSAVCYDETSGNWLYTAEVGDSIEGKGITVVGFDACFEGMLEVAYELRNDASFMIASEETEGGDGWEYNVWLSELKESAGTEKNLVNAVINAYEYRYKSRTGATLSCVDLSMIEELNTAFNNFSNAVSNGITSAAIQADVRNTIFGDVESFYSLAGTGDYNIDIWHLADVIQKNYNFADFEAAILKFMLDVTLWDSVIIDEWHNREAGLDGNPSAHGLAIHYCRIDGGLMNEHDFEYMNGYSWAYPLEFTQNSDWVPHYSGGVTGPGLLYTLFYETFD